MYGEMKLFAGSASVELAQQIASHLGQRVEPVTHAKFSDGELRIELESNVRGSTAFIIQSTCAPVNDSLMELLLIADALRRSSVDKIVAVIPYFGYSRQDRRAGYSRVPISARVVADMIQSVGIEHVITVDLHATQIQGFFNIPVDNISASQLFVADVYRKWSDERPIVVSPDVGGVARARHVAKQLGNTDLAIIDKRRPDANLSEVMNIIGDVVGRTCILIDDMVDTAGTLAKGANALIDVGGATRVVAYATHGVLSGNASTNIENSKLFSLMTADTIPLKSGMTPKVHHLPISELLAETIQRVFSGRSISEILE